MVTSAVKGEGKTSLACHLAMSMAHAGRKTLLIDGDLRRPAVHDLFGLGQAPGLSDLLRGDAAAPAEVTQRGSLADLDVMPAGRCDAAALRSLALGGFADVVTQVRGDYDFVVVDSAPVLAVSDSLLIGQCVDGVVVSVLRDVSRLPELADALDRLAGLGIRTMGAIVNGVQSPGYSSAEYYRNSYYTDALGGETP
jgi:succinoglycan biosynthesis transport protein ExoP